MGSILINLLHVVEPLLLLQVVSAVIIVEQQVVDCGRCHDATRDVEFGFPDIQDYLLGIRVLKKLHNLVVVDDIKRVSVIDVLLEQQELHLLFIVNSIHVFLGNYDDLILDFGNSSFQKGEILSYFLQ